MLARDLISAVIPALRPDDNGQQALNWMDTFRISHLPVVDGTRFLGLISDRSIDDLELDDRRMDECSDMLVQLKLNENQHIYEVVALVAEHQVSVVPVVTNNNEYLGVITLTDLAFRFAELVAVSEPGGVLVLKLNSIDYSMAEIARIVEGNDAKILSLYTSRSASSNEMAVTLKVNHMDLTGIIQTFERFNYTIENVFMDESILKNLYDDRYELLMKYLNF